MHTAVCPCCGSVVKANAMTDEVEVAEIIDCTGFPRSVANLFFLLFAAAGRTVTRTTLLDMMDTLRPSRPHTYMGLNTSIKRLNRLAQNMPFKVVPVYGLGYRLELSDANWHWKNK